MPGALPGATKRSDTANDSPRGSAGLKGRATNYCLTVFAKRKSVGSETLLVGYQNREEHPPTVAAQARSARFAKSLLKPLRV
jgi:hypothetical protein